MENVEYSAEEIRPNGHRISTCIPNEHYNSMRGKGPFDYQLPEPLIVKPQGDYVDVHVQVKRHDGYWKTSVLFYGVRLIPVSSSSSSQYGRVRETKYEVGVDSGERATCGIQ
jgi:hypothetical protein